MSGGRARYKTKLYVPLVERWRRCSQFSFIFHLSFFNPTQMAKLSLQALHPLQFNGCFDSKPFFNPTSIPTNFPQFKDGCFVPSRRLRVISAATNHVSLQCSQRQSLSKVQLFPKLCQNVSLRPSRSGFQCVEVMSIFSFSQEVSFPNLDDEQVAIPPNSGDGVGESLPPGKRSFKNRFLNFVRFGSVVNEAAESFFKSEIRRRLFVTASLLLISRVGYFIPIPGFDRRLIPQDYLSFVSGASDELGDYAPELKMSLFQLGISPQIAASILMQILCHIVPSLVKLRKEGLDGHEKIKSYIWWMSLGFAILEAVIVACHSLQFSIYAASHRFKHVMVTSLLLVSGAMTMTWICDKISDAGFGQGSSLVICVGILTSYTSTLYKMLCQFSGSALSWSPYALALLGTFMAVTMWAVVVTQGCRKIKLQYYGFKLASTARNESPVTEVEPYIPFNINPSGMQPVLTTSYLLAFPGIVASLLNSRFWEHVKEILNPETSIGAAPWVYYTIYAFFVFVFNIFDIANMPKEIAEYLNKIGARIPQIKPGKATVEYLTKIQASTRFWGGLLLSVLATGSSILDHYLRRINESYAIGFTSVLIIVGSIIDLRRSYQAYNVMPTLSKVLRRYGL